SGKHSSSYGYGKRSVGGFTGWRPGDWTFCYSHDLGCCCGICTYCADSDDHRANFARIFTDRGYSYLNEPGSLFYTGPLVDFPVFQHPETGSSNLVSQTTDLV